jgi:ArsR family transcriptional regulator, arsenate/arsenite/antimonite-responsive transcriptional repressor
MKNLLTDFKAFSDETRLRILALLEKGERCVCEIVAALQMDQPRISFHLKVLKKAGILKERKEERWIRYSIRDDDMLVRFLLLAVWERLRDDRRVFEDHERLDEFNRNRASCPSVVAFKARKP